VNFLLLPGDKIIFKLVENLLPGMNNDLFNDQVALAQIGKFFTDTWDKIATFFTSYQWQEILFTAKVIFIIISFLLLLAIIALLIRIIVISPLERSFFKRSKSERGPIFSNKKIKKRWTKIEKRFESGIEANYKLALIEADKLFDRVVKEMGYGKEKKLANIDEIKSAGKLKDKVIEEKKYKLSKEQTKEALKAYKNGLEELELL